MNKILVDQLKQTHAEMRAILNNVEKDGRQANKKEQELLKQLLAERDELLGNMLFYTY